MGIGSIQLEIDPVGRLGPIVLYPPIGSGRSFKRMRQGKRTCTAE